MNKLRGNLQGCMLMNVNSFYNSLISEFYVDYYKEVLSNFLQISKNQVHNNCRFKFDYKVKNPLS